MHYFRFIPIFLCFLMWTGAQPVLAQSPNTPFMNPDVNNHEFHRKCGIDEAIELMKAKDPNYEKEMQRLLDAISEIVANSKNYVERSMLPPVLNVPLVVHVIHSGEPIGTGMNLSDAQIEAQIDILNEDFAALNATFIMSPPQWQSAIGNPEVNFCLAVIDPDGNPTNGITRDQMTVTGSTIANSNIESVIKPATWWDSDEYYNIWTLPIPGTTASGGTTGYAYYPFPGTIGTSTDGTVVDYNWFGGPGFGQSGYKTLTHETGHYLGLPHTFQGDACNQDDGFADTPNIDAGTSTYTPNLNCSPNNFPTGPSSCGNEHMYINYMDYVNDDYCYTSFSNEQITLMRSVLNGTAGAWGYGSRLPLASNAVSVCTFYDNDAGTTDILYPSTFICNAGQIAPEVVITNFGQLNLNTVNINYKINNNAPVTTVWVTNLATAEKDTVTLAPYTPPAGTYTLTVYTTLPNGVPDEQLPNDTMSIQTLAITPLSLPLSEDFENAAFNPTINGLFVFDITNDGDVWERSTAASGFGNGGASAMFDNYSNGHPLGTIDALITQIYDFSTVTGAELSFDVGYTYYDDGTQVLTDTLIVLVSTNCGSNYNTQIYVKGGAELATAPSSVGPFTPSSSQWRTETVDLSAYDGIDNLSVMFVNYHGFGNRLFVDNINISLPCSMTLSASGINAACAGDCTGQVSVVPAGGTGTYTYDWSPNAGGANTAVVNNLCEGNYMVTVTDSQGCSDTISVILTDPSPLLLAVTTTDETAVGANDGTATANPSGGDNSGYTYAWSNNAGNLQSINNLPPDTYTVTVTDGSGCTVEEVFLIAPYDCGAYAITVTGTDISCFGANNGTATATVAPGTGTMPFTYVWSPSSANAATINNLIPGTYNVTVTDANGCSDTGSYTVVEPPVLSVSITTTDETAAGANDGTATATPTGGSGTTTYLWSNAGNTQTLNNLSPGPYTVTATDANGCTAESSGTVLPGPVDCSSFSISVTTYNDVNCFGLCNGGISLTVNSSATPFTFDWNDNTLDGLQNPTNLCAASYSVTVTDNDGCSATLTQVITQPTDLGLTLTATDPTCNGDCNGTVDWNATGGTAPFTAQIDGGTFTNLCAATYGVTVTDDNGCTESGTITVNETPLDVTSITPTPATCNNVCDGSIAVTATGNGPFTYSWTNGSGSQNQDNLCAGDYTVTLTNSDGCTTVLTATVTEPTILIANTSSTQITGAGLDDGTATASPSGGTPGYTYFWQPNGEITPTITGLAPGSYTVVVTDNNGCTTSETIVINPFDCGNFSISATATDVSCFGVCDGSITTTITGGTAPFNYDWSDNALDGEANPTGLCTNTYSVTITDNDGCSAVTNTAVTEPTALTVTLDGTGPTSQGANDATITANPAGGIGNYQYLWTPTNEITQTINNLPPGNYSVTVTDDNGCTTSEVIVILDVDCSSLTMSIIGTAVSCPGGADGTATAQVSGGQVPYTINWDNGDTGNQITNLPAGVYCATVTDSQGCTTIGCVTIEEPDPIAITVLGSQDLICAGDNNATVTVDASGGTGPYQYDWCNGQTGPTATGLSAGTCLLIVTDNNGCVLLYNWEVVEPLPLVLTTTSTDETSPGALDGSATVTASGESPFTFLWSTNEVTASINGLMAGIYTVTVTDNNGCTEETMVIVGSGVIDCSSLVLEIVTVNVSCSGLSDGSATAISSGGTAPYNYLWSDNSMGASINGLTAGVYQCVLTDANGCIVQQSFNVLEPPLLTVSIIGTDETTPGANDGTATATPEGGTTPYTFEWCNGGTSAMVTSLAPGICDLVVTDGNGCTVIESVTIAPAGVDCSGFGATITTTSVSCFGEADGSASITLSGGVDPIMYSWATGQNTATINNLESGLYVVTITDGNGCEIIQSETVGEPSALTANTSATDETAPGANDGTASTTPNGGTLPYTYLWCNGETGSSISNLPAGNCTVIITDANGCQLSEEVIIGTTGVDCTGFSSTITTTDVNCLGGDNGTALTTITGGSAPFTYIWSNGETTSSLDDLVADTYTVTITDDNGCELMLTGIIEEPATAVGATATSTDETSPGANDGTATVFPTGGTPPYSILWCNFETNTTVTNLPAGTCDYGVTDANGCLTLGSVLIGSPVDCSTFTASTTTQAVSCNAGSDGSVLASTNGGTAPFSYDWSSGSNSPSVNNLPAGVYAVTVVDANGCEAIAENVVTEPAEITVEVVTTDETSPGANDGTATATPDGGNPSYQYLWCNGQTTSMATNLSAGICQVTITDANGCQTITEATIGTNAVDCSELTMSISSEGVSCFGEADGAAVSQVIGGLSPYTYDWSNGANTAGINNLTAGFYFVTITDAQGCSLLDNIIVNEPLAVNVHTTGFDGNCGSNGSAIANVSGGTSPFSYLWNNGLTGSFISGLSAGSYQVTATDANGCTGQGDVFVQVNSQGIDIAYEATGVSCYGDSDGDIDVTIINGTAPFSFLWENGDTAEDRDDLSAGSYSVFVTDAAGCLFLSTIEVGSPAPLSVSIATTPANNGSNGTATAVVSGGTTPYSYNWDGPQTVMIDNLGTGSYTVTVTDANGCTAEKTVNLGTTSVSDLSSLLSLTLFPNPNDGAFVLLADFREMEEVRVVVYNVLGQVVFQQEVEGQRIEVPVDLRELANGTYLVQLKTKEGFAVRKVVKG